MELDESSEVWQTQGLSKCRQATVPASFETANLLCEHPYAVYFRASFFPQSRNTLFTFSKGLYFEIFLYLGGFHKHSGS
jgi:hypothetical protein